MIYFYQGGIGIGDEEVEQAGAMRSDHDVGVDDCLANFHDRRFCRHDIAGIETLKRRGQLRFVGNMSPTGVGPCDQDDSIPAIARHQSRPNPFVVCLQIIRLDKITQFDVTIFSENVG